ncbi:MAG TPA: 16S rRNA (cytosine(1402)-N(4))-methyltransferase RsmH [Chitinophagales bacterium]|jgi:16S rRNA (cytosine1402-N4)-methyltransferase|nr:16S rRNA (cytosine(1402)-N(4))-methyltransferase RsmH [Chitinophagales bacterium]MBP6154400.1 16S rRNA (cytosine(1402)-N(4))-methyltransferase RsmH [Chitinophagales bacterium]HQV77984.1 16S rRNA (cytosine(1402)-N(4))-methyltransferase RsmH [Chitinophagales bacterium]HQW78706.1 16S rRNA (cytosine(1402)-N(4))-methyltransferase RsmH [Chitinophagales bacterium]HRB18556.1 16S rRNA (cytosine(1402)-N(4))-methyltransferase RsmH [Chitinophagales bacterium]
MYHIPVMLNECIEGLQIKPDGIYVDVTFGGGGHSKKILENLHENGKLFAFDVDDDAKRNIPNDKRFTLIQSNYRHLKRFLKLYNITKVNGILADFGISSHQIDEPSRGFATRFDAPLDMRMNAKEGMSAKEIVNTYSAEQLQHILGFYGEVINAKTLAHKIVEHRQLKPIETTKDLVDVCKTVAKGIEVKYLSQVFQAIRIEVNDELNAIKDFLQQSEEVLETSGRLVIMSYHSLEDRLTKNFIKNGVFEGEPHKDIYGNFEHHLKAITKKPIEASTQELKINSRARSAKLRIAEKI